MHNTFQCSTGSSDRVRSHENPMTNIRIGVVSAWWSARWMWSKNSYIQPTSDQKKSQSSSLTARWTFAMYVRRVQSECNERHRIFTVRYYWSTEDWGCVHHKVYLSVSTHWRAFSTSYIVVVFQKHRNFMLIIGHVNARRLIRNGA